MATPPDSPVDEVVFELEPTRAPKHRPVALEDLCRQTKFSRHEIRVMYRGFKQVRTLSRWTGTDGDFRAAISATLRPLAPTSRPARTSLPGYQASPPRTARPSARWRTPRSTRLGGAEVVVASAWRKAWRQAWRGSRAAGPQAALAVHCSPISSDVIAFGSP